MQGPKFKPTRPYFLGTFLQNNLLLEIIDNCLFCFTKTLHQPNTVAYLLKKVYGFPTYTVNNPLTFTLAA